ncbi:MAG TPA: PSD1 and planctomycete cytochrome C domain-containing protein [Planctomycetota bacterium]|nr:PSD1 and planctomycete cytochrome C domain-containing protein [Planctomycetota bacterium]
MPRRPFLTLILFAAAFAHAADDKKLPPPAPSFDFGKDIQPILANSCVQCHSGAKPKGALSLETRELLMKGGKSDKAIMIGDSAKSILIRYVAGLEDEMEMPPKGKGAPLTAQQIALLRVWIDQGAKWPDGLKIEPKPEDKNSAAVAQSETKKIDPQSNRGHWAFKCPAKPALPTLAKFADKVQSPIDAFVLARLEKDGLAPAPLASKLTLLRRVSLDLTGLPPSIKEADDFLADNSPDAYRKLVDRLLASPHYGERWGRHWLDAARYADSDGFEKDKPRFAWAYRDWVINAFNQNMPYDKFVIEQIAGDEMPSATQDDIVATGFLRNSMINEEGGVDPEQFRMEAMFDRMDAIGKSVLGLSINCCQCHNHKFDPITQDEYYKMFAFLNNDYEATTAVYTPEQLKQRSDILRQIAEIEGDLKHKNADWVQRMAAWEASVKNNQPEWIVLRPEIEDISTGGQRYLPQPDGSFLAQGYAPTKHTVKMIAHTDIEGITAFRLELLTDPNLPFDGPGRSYIKGTCALTEFSVEFAPETGKWKAEKIKFTKASADYGDPPNTPLEKYYDDKSNKPRVTGPVDYAIDGKEETAWGIDAGSVRRNQPRKAVFNAEAPFGYEQGTVLTILLKQNHGGWNSDDLMTNNLGRMRVSITTAPDAAADPLPKNVREILDIPAEKRSPAQTAIVFSYWRTTVADWNDANDKIEALWKQHPNPATQLVLKPREDMRDTFVLKRGDMFKPLQKISAGVPEILNPLPPDAPPTRMTFGKWLVDKKSPTAARAFVNRVWQHYFGIGLVSSSEDLGSQCETPSNPQLLDWLACEFMDSGWDVKALHRLIVSSNTYKQSSVVTPGAYAKDQYNRLLARGPRFRVEGEIVRDIALSASGLINLKMGGRSVMPPAPAFLFVAPASYAPFPWIDETGDEKYRRAVYTYRRRSTPYPLLQTFDTPEGNTSCVRRQRSDTPLQALMTLNETLAVESAQALARRALKEGGATDADRVAFAFRCALTRPPSADESEALLDLLNKQRERLKDGKLNALEIAAGKGAKSESIPKELDAKEAAAYTIVARVLLNLDETITKE